MRQELTFLVAPDPPDRPRARAGLPPAGRRRRPAPSPSAPSHPPRPGPPGLTHAHLLLLRHPDLAARPARPAADARHDRPQHRQRLDHRATRARRPRWPPRQRCSSRSAARQRRPARTSARASTCRASAASATSSSTSSTARQNTSLSDWTAQRRRAGHRRALALAEPGDSGINAQLVEVLDVLVGPLQRARTSAAAKQALVEQAARADRLDHTSVRAQLRRRAGSARRTEYSAITAPGRRGRRRSPPSSPTSNKTIRSSSTTGDAAERPDGPPRPAARPAVDASARSRSSSSPAARTNVSFVDATTRRRRTRSSPTRPRTGPARRPATWSPGGQLGGLLTVGQSPAARSTATSTHARLVRDRRSADNGQHRLRRQLLHVRHARRGRRSQVAAPIQAAPAEHRAPAPATRAPTTSRSPSRSCAAAPASTAPTRRSCAEGRLERQRGHAHAGQRAGARRLGRGPPPERRRRLDGRGDVEPRPLPARLPGLGARHVDDGRDARRRSSTGPEGSVCEPCASPPR